MLFAWTERYSSSLKSTARVNKAGDRYSNQNSSSTEYLNSFCFSWSELYVSMPRFHIDRIGSRFQSSSRILKKVWYNIWPNIQKPIKNLYINVLALCYLDLRIVRTLELYRSYITYRAMKNKTKFIWIPWILIKQKTRSYISPILVKSIIRIQILLHLIVFNCRLH